MGILTKHRRYVPEKRRRVVGSALALAIVLMLSVVALSSAQAQTYTYSVLHEFLGSVEYGDATSPNGDMVFDAQGNLYGTSPYGGSPYCGLGSRPGLQYGCGTIFKLDTTGAETVLYSFTNTPDGYEPIGGLVWDAEGNLYGTTLLGGTYGFGTIFKLDPSGNETVLYSFTDGADGGGPVGTLTRDASGNLYGVNDSEGSGANGGTVFKLDASGNLSTLYSFCSLPNCADGDGPNGGMVIDAQGNLYGTTHIGGTSSQDNEICFQGCGTVFKVDTAGNETVLYNFNFIAGQGETGSDGAQPMAGLLMDAQGNLYGTTYYGGVAYPMHNGGEGTVF